MKYLWLIALLMLAAACDGPNREEVEARRTAAREARQAADEARQATRETQAMLEENKRTAQETLALVEKARQEAEALQAEAEMKQKTSAVQGALQEVALAEVAYMVDTGAFTDNFEELYQYGWRHKPDLIYERIELSQAADGQPSFRAVVRHKDESIPAFVYDNYSGQGVVPLEE